MEIQRALIKAGASSIQQEFDGSGQVEAVSFRIRLADQEINFRLPADWRSVREVLKQQKVEGRYKSDDHSRRVAWRIVKDWVEAQMAILETKMVTLPQLFLPYAVRPDGTTLYEAIAADPRLLLGDGSD